MEECFTLSKNFFNNQSDGEKNLYIDLLEVTGSLSNLFTESNSPYLYYRAMENIFCKAFDANNLSRSDISVDAKKDGLGIGLKTFLQKNGNTFQKIAEFNKDSNIFRNLTDMELVKKVASMRNERIKTTMRICELEDIMYHLVTRSNEYMAIYEEHMDLIDIDNIKITKRNENTIHFNDNINDYSFNLSKSTLLKRFDTSDTKKIFGFYVKILDNPYDFLLSIKSGKNSINQIQLIDTNDEIIDYIILPLYSPKTNKVEERSGLNQWNANGRKRNVNEVYIRIPSFIHKYKKNFFDYSTSDYRTKPFNVKLPNGKNLTMRVAQQGGKALMSNPNSALGEWILREILELRPMELVTKEQLDIIGIDSVKLSKSKTGNFYLDFLKTGSFKAFEEEYIEEYK